MDPLKYGQDGLRFGSKRAVPEFIRRATINVADGGCIKGGCGDGDVDNDAPPKKRTRCTRDEESDSERAGVITKTKILNAVYGRVVEHPSWRLSVLPGVCPKVMTAEHVRNIKRGGWMCAPKTDGQRVIVFVEDGVATFFDRSFSVLFIGVVQQTLDKMTVLDGELIHCNEDDTQILVVHDAFCVEGINVSNINFKMRLRMAMKVCEKLGHKLVSTIYVVCKVFRDAVPANIKDVRSQKFTIDIEGKPFRTINSDGVIFIDSNQPAHNQRDDVIVKWKADGECTLDFVVGGDGVTLFLHHNDNLFPCGRSVTREVPGVSEFNMRPNGEWVFVKQRPDRKKPNSASSAFQTMMFKTVCKVLWDDLVS